MPLGCVHQLGVGSSKALGRWEKSLLLLGTVTGQTGAHLAQVSTKGFSSPRPH